MPMLAISLIFLIAAAAQISLVRASCSPATTVLLETLPRFSDPTADRFAAIDSIALDGRPQPLKSPLHIRRNQTLEVRGWARDPHDRRPAIAVYASLDRNVAAYRASPAAPGSSDFYVAVPTETLAAGAHVIRIRVIDGNPTGYYEPLPAIRFALR